MIRSMTGFGRAQCATEECSISAELRSVNHRYFELSTRLPRQYSFLEEKVKSYLQDRISRGKVECNLYIELYQDANVSVRVNQTLAAGYLAALEELSESLSVPNNINALNLAKFNDVLSVQKEEADEDAVWALVLPVLEEATNRFLAMREREGQKLKEDVLEKADSILEDVRFVEARSPETVKEYHEKLKARVQELLEDASVDEGRLLTEVAIHADKVAVDEETVRLHSHIDQLKAMLEEEEAIGRKMDFLVQEINREANTIGSKASDLEITAKVLDIKGKVEKIREQIQNIE